jgi:ribosomal protein L7/L12
MSRDEKEGHILDLVLAGQKIDAIKAARELYGYDLANAKRLVEGLVEN